MAAALAEVDEGVTGVHAFEPRSSFCWGMASEPPIHGAGDVRGAAVAAVLAWPVLTPLGGVGGELVDFDKTHEGHACFLLGERVDEQGGGAAVTSAIRTMKAPMRHGLGLLSAKGRTLPVVVVSMLSIGDLRSLLPGRVSDALVAMDAADGVGIARAAGNDAVNNLTVTAEAVLLQDRGVLRGDLDGLPWKLLRVKALECRKPLSVFDDLGPKPWGRWRSTPTAAVWCVAFCQEDNWSCMMWQLAAHTPGDHD